MVAGRRLIARVDAERATLRELLAQSLRLSYEIAGREKELAAEPGTAPNAQTRKDPPQVSEDEELWPFQESTGATSWAATGTSSASRCKRPRSPLPTASQPAPAPEKVAGNAEGLRTAFHSSASPISPPVRGEVREWRLHGCRWRGAGCPRSDGEGPG